MPWDTSDQEALYTSLKQSHSLKNFRNRLKQRHHKTFTNNLSFLKETNMVSHKKKQEVLAQ